MSNQSFEKDGLSSVAVEAVKDLGLLKRRAVSGVFFLGIRRVVLQVILTGSNIILYRILFPGDFGAFAIALGIVNLLAIFASLGLETALVQKKDEPKKEELQATFTITLFLSSLTAILVIMLAPLLTSFYQEQLGKAGIFYLRLLSLFLVVSGLRGVSSMLLERRLDYFRLVIGEVSETLILQATTILLALKGFGVLSFIYGSLTARFLGFIIFFILSPWPLSLRFSLKAVRGILPFGVNFQLNTIVGGLNGAVVPIFVGKVAGSAGVGFLNWAGGLAVAPRAIPEIFSRLIFPVCSRSQDDKKLLKVIIEKSIQLSCLTSFPLIIILVALAYPVTYLIYTDKWFPGIPALYFFSLQSIFVIIGGIFTQTLLALGEAKTVRNISLFWAILQWALTVPLVFKFGFIGLAVASMLVSATFFIPLALLRKRVEFKIAPHVLPYLFYSLIAGAVSFWFNNQRPAQKFLDLLVFAGVGGLVYLILIFIFERKEIIEDFIRVRKILFS